MGESKKYFGTDGIRGKFGDALINPEFMLKLGWAAGQVLAREKSARVLIGRDTRVSGAILESALQAGLSATGVDVQLLGVLPTPAVAYLTCSLRASASIIISASHNYYQDNGVKFFDGNGKKLSDTLEKKIEEELTKPFKTVASEHLGQIQTLLDAAGRYIEFCKSTFPVSLNLNHLKIVVDCANGAASEIAPKIFHELGAEVIAIHHHPDGLNINREGGATDIRELQKKVLQHHADVGIALDGDADRLIMVDHRGEKVDGDELLCIMALETPADYGEQFGIVGTVMSNLGLEQALQQRNIPFVRTSVGDRYVLEELMKKGWKLGGESSGHIVNLNHTTTGDGIISALQILRVIQSSGKNLHDLKRQMMKHPQVLINVPVFGNKDLKKYPKISKAVIDAEQAFQGRGRVLLRPSGTEPLVRVMVEGEEEQTVREVAESLAGLVEKELNG